MPFFKMTMRALKIGDKVYNVKRDGFEDFARYSFSTVERLTKTLAVLKNGVRLRNEPKVSYIMEEVGYSVNGEWGTHWHIVSLTAIRTAQEENEKIKAQTWFDEKTFSLKEKQLVYQLFKESANIQLKDISAMLEKK